MKVAVFSDVHDNMARWQEAAGIIKEEEISIGVCCGDVTSIESLLEISKSFKTLYLALGNADYKLANMSEKVPKNVMYFERIGAFELGGKKIAVVHNNKQAINITESDIYDIIFYGHTHTPWEKKIRKSITLCPGEVAGHYGPASFCIYDLKTLKGTLKLLK